MTVETPPNTVLTVSATTTPIALKEIRQTAGNRVGPPGEIDLLDPVPGSEELPGGEHRDHGQRDPQRHEQGEGHGQRLIAEHLPATPSTNTIGTNTQTVVIVLAITARPTSEAPPRAASTMPTPWSRRRWIASRTDDRVVQQQADAERDPAQRHDVQRHAGDVHQEEGRHDGDRDRDADDQRLRRAAKEQEQDDDRERAADQGRLDHGRHGVADVARLVGEHGQLELRVDLPEILLELLHPIEDGGRDGHRVRAALLV